MAKSTYKDKKDFRQSQRKIRILENYFGKMKNDMFYRHVYNFETLEELKQAMEESITYCNKKKYSQIKRIDSFAIQKSILTMNLTICCIQF